MAAERAPPVGPARGEPRDLVQQTVRCTPRHLPGAAAGRKSFDADPRWRKLLPLHVRRVDERFWRLTVLKPNTLISLDGEAAERRTAWLSVRLVQRFLERHTSPQRWLWIYPPNPFSTALVNRLPHDRLICDIVDDVVSATDAGREHCEALVQKSAATFTTSADLADRLRPWQPRAVYVPNGLEPSFIAKVEQAEPRRRRSGVSSATSG